MGDINTYSTLNIPDLQPAPGVGFNLTFVCPEGQVLDNKKVQLKINFSKKGF